MTDFDADILIVGAGLAGATTAYHLKRASDKRVIVVDMEATPGEHSSGRNASYIRERMERPALQPLATEGARELRKGEMAEYLQCGALLIGLGDEDVSKHVPPARGKALWCPEDGIVDVAALLQHYLAGQDVRCNTKVQGWSRRGEGVVVETSRGEITCRLVVNAAGPWAGVLGAVPLTPMNRHIFATPPMDWVDLKWPFVWDVEGGIYFRPESGGLLLSACDEQAAEPGDYTENPDVLDDLAEKFERLQPGLQNLSILRSWVGQRTFAADRLFVIGFDPRDDRLFHVAGLGGHGVTTSYAVGRIATELILGEHNEFESVFAPSRLI